MLIQKNVSEPVNPFASGFTGMVVWSLSWGVCLVTKPHCGEVMLVNLADGSLIRQEEVSQLDKFYVVPSAKVCCSALEIPQG